MAVIKNVLRYFRDRYVEYHNKWKYRSPIWLIGDGRSGTTWVASVIDYDNRHKNFFEPFHPYYDPTKEHMVPNQYVRPNTQFSCEKFVTLIFSGNTIGWRSNTQTGCRLHSGLLVKDIFANLFARWAYERYPRLKIVLLMRNPFAVALSKYKKIDWNWMTEPRDFLEQEQLMEDFLEPFRDVIESVENDYIVKQILIWAIINYVPLQQFSEDEIYVLRYENLYENSESEVTRLLKFTHGSTNSTNVQSALRNIEKISVVAGVESLITQGLSPVDAWKVEITQQQMDAGIRILNAFGFNELGEFIRSPLNKNTPPA